MMASTGHLVLTQLHAADGAGALKRLIDIGIEPYLAGMTVEGIVSQRLARKICNHCREEVKNSSVMLEPLVNDIEDTGALRTTYAGKGCRHCHDSGYRERGALYEIITDTNHFQEILARNLPVTELRKELKRLGYKSLRQSALERALEGIITLEEALRCSAL
jgi:type II secretory ATPase GspE/PulE/Tfp pilus assembly ATPase PilB-like protein